MGLGKIVMVEVLVGELWLLFFVICFESLIMCFMGEMVVKLWFVFDEVYWCRGVYLFDEFDVVGSNCLVMNDVVEMCCVLNSFF